MAIRIDAFKASSTVELLALVLSHARNGDRVQFLCDAGNGPAVVQRLRVALSRSRKRNVAKGKKPSQFTLCHSIHKHTENAKRYDSIVMWTEKKSFHVEREILDDLLEREA